MGGNFQDLDFFQKAIEMVLRYILKVIFTFQDSNSHPALPVHVGIFRESDDEYSDDDDMSWKVRRSAAKCVEAVISTRHEMLAEFYRSVSPALIARFKGTCLPLAFAVPGDHVER